MMLYTVVPLERIYARPDGYPDIRQEKPKEKAEAEYREVPLQYGRIVTRREGENYIIERINSTDMSDYLRDDYMPGRLMNGNGSFAQKRG